MTRFMNINGRHYRVSEACKSIFTHRNDRLDTVIFINNDAKRWGAYMDGHWWTIAMILDSESFAVIRNHYSVDQEVLDSLKPMSETGL